MLSNTINLIMLSSQYLEYGLGSCTKNIMQGAMALRIMAKCVTQHNIMPSGIMNLIKLSVMTPFTFRIWFMLMHNE
jgi:hypothetical protein